MQANDIVKDTSAYDDNYKARFMYAAKHARSVNPK